MIDILTYDITDFMTWFVNLFISIFQYVYNILDSITFSGFSLLAYTITILVLGALIPLLFTIANSSVSIGYREGRLRGRAESRKARRDNK